MTGAWRILTTRPGILPAGTLAKIPLAAFLSMAVCWSIPAEACPIPVFRYSVEYWEPDPYRITVFYRGGSEQSMPEDPAADIIEYLRGPVASQANIAVSLIDVEEQPQAIQRYLDGDRTLPELPWMVVRYPAITRREQPLWRGAANLDNLSRLLDSPVRRQAAEELARGKPVWLLLESGNRARDNRAMELLNREVARLEQVLELPDPEQWWDQRDGGPAPEIRFSTMRLARDDRAEEFLVRMLAGSEPDLDEMAAQPMVFPLYGRGICMWAIVGDGIDPRNLTRAAEFLAGPCSCQVKMLNPGIDLLISKNWAAAVQVISDTMLAPVGAMSSFEERGREVGRRLAGEVESIRQAQPEPESLPAPPADAGWSQTGTDADDPDPLDLMAERISQAMSPDTELDIPNETDRQTDRWLLRLPVVLGAIAILLTAGAFALFRSRSRA